MACQVNEQKLTAACNPHGLGLTTTFPLSSYARVLQIRIADANQLSLVPGRFPAGSRGLAKPDQAMATFTTI